MGRIKLKRSATAHIKPAEETYNPENFPPRFSFRFLVKHADFGFESLNDDGKVALANTLHKLSNLTWAQIRLAHKHGLGHEKIEIKDLNFTLPSGISPNRSILAFRFYGKAPMLGYRSDYGTFYIVAFDPKFKAYKHD
jgi:hypothetical protein